MGQKVPDLLDSDGVEQGDKSASLGLVVPPDHLVTVMYSEAAPRWCNMVVAICST